MAETINVPAAELEKLLEQNEKMKAALTKAAHYYCILDKDFQISKLGELSNMQMIGMLPKVLKKFDSPDFAGATDFFKELETLLIELNILVV